MKGSVVQPWVNELSWKEQTVLFCALRGPDAGGTKILKGWTRFIRKTVLENAAPKKTFMQNDPIPDIYMIAMTEPLALDMLPVHYLGHLMHALQVIAYRHPASADKSDPNRAPGEIARDAYLQLCDYLHVQRETLADMTIRLADEV